jgi:Chaperone for flagella basal body P-ring formation
MYLPRSLSALLCASSLSLAALSPAHAEDLAVEGERVQLYAVLPALAGTELGNLVVADAPLPGETRVVRASDIKAVLKANGRDARGLDLPRSIRLVRKARDVSDSELGQRVRAAVAAQIAPCQLQTLSTLPQVSVGGGDYEVEASLTPRRDSGRAPLTIIVKQGERTQRISAQAELSCPAPVIQPGMSVKLISVQGPVRVSAPATAHQAGRVGDEVRVTNQVTKAQLRARVVDAQTVEVLR